MKKSLVVKVKPVLWVEYFVCMLLVSYIHVNGDLGEVFLLHKEVSD